MLISNLRLRLIYFNSIKVRLEYGSFRKAIADLIGFQFHKGTIRTKVETFHHLSPSHFNSIKVRLELEVRHLIDDVVGYFNSIKVRLELRSAFSFRCRRIISIP